MEEKNVTKISLSTFLLIIAIIAIAVMGACMYKLYMDKETENQKSTELQAQVNSLNATVGNMQGKINSISNTIKEKDKIAETTQTTYPNNTGDFSMMFSYIVLKAEYTNNESIVEVTVKENNLNDSPGKVTLGTDPSDGVDRNIKYTNIKEKIVDVLFDVDLDGKIYTITLLTSTGKAYTTPWGYRYTDSQANMYQMGENIVGLSYDDKGGYGYDKNGKVVFHTGDIYQDGY